MTRAAEVAAPPRPRGAPARAAEGGAQPGASLSRPRGQRGAHWLGAAARLRCELPLASARCPGGAGGAAAGPGGGAGAWLESAPVRDRCLSKHHVRLFLWGSASPFVLSTKPCRGQAPAGSCCSHRGAGCYGLLLPRLTCRPRAASPSLPNCPTRGDLRLWLLRGMGCVHVCMKVPASLTGACWP